MIEATIFRSSLLDKVENLAHGYSSRQHGDMQSAPDNRASFATSIGLRGELLSKPQQNHTSGVVYVDMNSGSMINRVDGLVSIQRPLCIISADCAPILAVDPTMHVIGVAHSGWQGTIDGIATNLIAKMVEHGASKKEIRVAIGPRIGLSCYDVPLERAKLFRDKYGARGIVKKFGEKWHIDIGEANVRELRSAGVPQMNIDVLPFCTSCDNNRLFSFRKDSDGSYGETVGVIGWKN